MAGQTAMDYPALTTLLVLLVLSVVPLVQYADWVIEGEGLAASFVDMAERTLDNSMSAPTSSTNPGGSAAATPRAANLTALTLQSDRGSPSSAAAEEARKAVGYYQRAWWFASSRPSPVRLDVARAHLILAVTAFTDSEILSELDQAAAIYAVLSTRTDSQPEGLAGLMALCSVADPGPHQCAQDAVQAFSPASLSYHPADSALRAQATRYYHALLEIQTTLGDFDAVSSTYRSAAAALPEQLGRPVRVELSAGPPEANTFTLPSGDGGHIPSQVLAVPFASGRQLVRISYASGQSNTLTPSSEFVVQPASGPQTVPVSLTAGHPRLYLQLRQQLQAAVRSDDSAAFAEAAHAALRTGSNSAVAGVCWLGTLRSMAESVMPACQAAAQNKSSRFAQDALGLALAQVGQYDDAVVALRAAQTSSTDAHSRFRARWISAAQSDSDPLQGAPERAVLLDEVTGPNGVLGTYLTRSHAPPGTGT